MGRAETGPRHSHRRRAEWVLASWYRKGVFMLLFWNLQKGKCICNYWQPLLRKQESDVFLSLLLGVLYMMGIAVAGILKPDTSRNATTFYGEHFLTSQFPFHPEWLLVSGAQHYSRWYYEYFQRAEMPACVWGMEAFESKYGDYSKSWVLEDSQTVTEATCCNLFIWLSSLLPLIINQLCVLKSWPRNGLVRQVNISGAWWWCHLNSGCHHVCSGKRVLTSMTCWHPVMALTRFCTS